MSRRAAASWLAWSVCAAILLILALSLLLIVLGWSTPLPQGRTPWHDQAVSLVGLIGALLFTQPRGRGQPVEKVGFDPIATANRARNAPKSVGLCPI
jgi:hypothetical protein